MHISPFCICISAGGGTGEEQSKEDQRVLTLAEQFLAAMPDRIKFETAATETDDTETDSIIFPDCCSSVGQYL